MNKMERAALDHAAEWLRYQRSPQYALDLAADIKRRAEIDRKAGHVPGCTLNRCATGCTWKLKP